MVRATNDAGSSPRKRWIDTAKECLKKRDLGVRQVRRMVHDRSVWQEFVRGVCMGRWPGDEPLTLTKCYICDILQTYEDSEERKSVCGQAQNLRAYRENFLFSCLLGLLTFYFHSFHGMMRVDPAVAGEG